MGTFPYLTRLFIKFSQEIKFIETVKWGYVCIKINHHQLISETENSLCTKTKEIISLIFYSLTFLSTCKSDSGLRSFSTGYRPPRGSDKIRAASGPSILPRPEDVIPNEPEVCVKFVLKHAKNLIVSSQEMEHYLAHHLIFILYAKRNSSLNI